MNSIRRVSTGHLVFGLIFLGITAIWVVGETTDIEAPALAIWGPVVLIAAGAVGLASTLFNSRQARAEERRQAEEYAAQHDQHDTEQSTQWPVEDTEPPAAPAIDDADVVHHEEK